MAELLAAVDPSDEDDAEATISVFLQGIEDDVAGVQRVAPLRDPVVTGTFTVLADGRTFLEGPAATRGRSPPQLRRGHGAVPRAARSVDSGAEERRGAQPGGWTGACLL